MHTTKISGHHIDVTPAIKDHINEKLSKISKLTDQITSVNVTLLKDNKSQKAKQSYIFQAKKYLPRPPLKTDYFTRLMT